METLDTKSPDLGWAAMVIATGAFTLLTAWVLLAGEGGGMMGPGMGWSVAWAVLLMGATVTVIVISVVLILAAVTNEPEDRATSQFAVEVRSSRYALDEISRDQTSRGDST